MKRTIILTVLLIGGLHKPASAGSYDSAAVMILDRMSDLIGSLESCRFQLSVASDQGNNKGELIKYFTQYDVSFSGPNKLLVDAHGQHGHRQLRYNGKQLAYYSYTENNYGLLPAPTNTIAMIDSVNRKYGFEFPAADFFYPGFTDDLINHSDSIVLLEPVYLNEMELHHIMVYARDYNAQFWVENGAYTLPCRFSITYKNKSGNPQYTGIFSGWEMNTRIPPTLFEFSPPPGARKLRIMGKSGI